MGRYIDIKTRAYKGVLELQETLRNLRIEDKIPDTIIFCEHYPVYTIGRQDSSSDFISDLKTITDEGIKIIKTDRGGRITYHGPGQLVGYLIFNIDEMGVGIKRFVEKLEDICINTLKMFGVSAVKDRDYPGLWVEDKKIVAIGLHVTKGTTLHGFALNIDPNLAHYRHIIPCGVRGRGVTSIKEVTGISPPRSAVVSALIEEATNEFDQPFECSLTGSSPRPTRSS